MLIVPLAELALSDCDVRRGATVFVESDETTPCRRISSVLDAFRRLLLQIGGANIAGADRA